VAQSSERVIAGRLPLLVERHLFQGEIVFVSVLRQVSRIRARCLDEEEPHRKTEQNEQTVRCRVRREEERKMIKIRRITNGYHHQHVEKQVRVVFSEHVKELLATGAIILNFHVECQVLYNVQILPSLGQVQRTLVVVIQKLRVNTVFDHKFHALQIAT